MKRILKTLLFLAVTLIAFFFLTVGVSAFEENIDSYKDEFDFQGIADAIDDETVGILAEIGIDEISAEKLYSVNVEKVFTVLFDISKRSFTEPLKFLVSATGILILTTLFSIFQFISNYCCLRKCSSGAFCCHSYGQCSNNCLFGS